MTTVIVANHYQNENCHPDGKIKIGIAEGAPWREERLANARRLFAGARAAGIAIAHVRLAVDPDFTGVQLNTPIFRQWAELGAWQEGTWGVEFIEGLGPETGEPVITHTRNSGFHEAPLGEALFKLGARHLICCGVSTAYTVESTVRHATDIGYHVTVASDACSTATQSQHENALSAMSLLAEIKTVDEVLAMLGAG
ncbi:MAG: isochorismatase family cysteine hydrolase [Pseudomonadota bacterium]